MHINEIVVWWYPNSLLGPIYTECQRQRCHNVGATTVLMLLMNLGWQPILEGLAWCTKNLKTINSSVRITFRSRTGIAKSNEQLKNWSWLVKFQQPCVNWFSPADGRGNFEAFSTCLRHGIQFPYQTKMIPNSASRSDIANNLADMSLMLGVNRPLQFLLQIPFRTFNWSLLC